jgi:hypothetical protein
MNRPESHPGSHIIVVIGNSDFEMEFDAVDACRVI